MRRRSNAFRPSVAKPSTKRHHFGAPSLFVSTFVCYAHPPISTNSTFKGLNVSLTLHKSSSLVTYNSMAPTESKSSINSPSWRIDPGQPTYAPGNNAMGRTVDTSNRVHVNQSAGFPDIIPIPELSRSGLSNIPRTQQQNLTQGTPFGLQGSRYTYRSATHEWDNSG